ncbi:MAG: aspartate--tRNA(Asn) ligase [Clostridia bacterium]|nr:aspartate--tRNA(Asn) ligase [Clostridia bacterium]
MERSFISQLTTQSENVCLQGWIHKIKEFKDFAFVILRDCSGVVQLVIDNDETLKALQLEMSVEVQGKVLANKKATGGVEVKVDALKILGKTYYDLLPFAINGKEIQTTLETELDYRSMSLRRPDRRAVFKVQEEIVEAFRTYFREHNFSEIHTPKIIGSETEGGSEVFTVNYFDRRTFLAQSPQFYKQMMVGAGFERVFEIGHAYRAESHNTWRHLNEYVSLDVEMAFIEDEYDLMNLEEDLMKHIFSHLNESCAKELAMYKVELPKIKEIPRIPLADAQRILLEKFGKKSPVGNIDAEGESLFMKHVKEEYHSDFVFLTKYPASKRPVYTMPDDQLEGMTKSFDLIYKGLEITTGGQRIHDYEMLKQNMIDFGCNPDDFDFYLDSFRYGMPPHGGYAIGLERITMMILGLDNIRKATLLPRDMKRITP